MARRDTQEEFIAKVIAKYGDQYTFEKTVYKTSKQKITVTCKDHGDVVVQPGAMLNADKGCPACGWARRSISLEEFIRRSREHHGDKFDYSKVSFEKINERVKIGCPVHGEFVQLVHSHMNGRGCKKCAVDATRRLLTKEEFVSLANKAHGGTYDYSLVPSVIEKYDSDGTFICREHGPFKQRYRKHTERAQGCPVCSYDNRNGLRLTFEEVVKRGREVHGDRFEYIKYDAPYLTFRCADHGEIVQFVHSHFNGHACASCATIISKPHQAIIDMLVGENIVTNDRSVLEGRKEIDVYLPDYNFGVEIDGLYWHSEKHKPRLYHYEKAEAAWDAGITLYQFFDSEIRDKPEIVESMINSVLGKTKRIFARKCVVKKIDQKTYTDFLDRNHLQGAIFSTIRLGLFFEDELVSVIGISKRLKEEQHLDRFCTKLNTTVVGGFSKLLSKVEDVDVLYTFSDNRYSEGKVYEKSGFERVGLNKTTLYFTDGLQLYNRNRFMRHKLEEEFGKKFPKEMTASEICEMHGIYRIWGPGTMKWRKQL